MSLLFSNGFDMAGGRKKYLLRFPTFEDVRFLDGDNPIESDISDDENSHLKYLIKCNGWTKLNLKARNVYRLINQYNTSIWTPETVKRPEGYEDYLLRPVSILLIVYLYKCYSLY